MNSSRSILFNTGSLLALLLLVLVLPEYHQGNFARIMVLACFACAYNISFGYTGLLSLGHAMFFSAGLYGVGLTVQLLDFPAELGFLIGIGCGAVLAFAVGLLALRTTGVSFMIVTLMFSQAFFLTILLFGEVTRGDEGFVIAQAKRTFFGVDLSSDAVRLLVSWVLICICVLICQACVRSRLGKVLIAIRENEERTRMLGYDVFRAKLYALTLSGAMAALAGGAYGLLFGYAGATFASVQYSIFPLLWVLLGGAGTLVGPLIGTALMFYLIDISSGITSAYMLVAGVALVLLTLYVPEGIVGTLRRRYLPWIQ